MKKITINMKYITYIFVAALFLSACNNNEEDENSDISIPVSVEEIKLKPIEKFIETTGTVQPTKEVSLKSEMAGKYRLMTNPKTGKPFRLGDMVEKGTKIVEIYDKEYENNIKIEAQKLQLEISKQTYEKQKSLYDKGGVTLSDLKNSEINMINAEYAYNDALLRLSKKNIEAPFRSVIVELPYYTEDTRIEANAQLVKLMDYSAMLMEIQLPEKNITSVEVNQTVRITNYSMPEDTIVGKVTQLSPAIDADSRTFKGSLLIDNPNLQLRPGMFVKADIIVARKDSALVIPKDIILSKQRGHTVFVIEKGIADERLIQFGMENPNEVEIISGLEPKERLVIRGFETLRDNSKVKIVR